MIGVCEALLYGYKAGLEPRDGARDRSAAAPRARGRSEQPRPADHRRGNFEPGFFVEHFIKDMGIALAEARRMNLVLPGAALAEQLYVAVRSQGLGRKGTQSLAVVIAQLAQADWPRR